MLWQLDFWLMSLLIIAAVVALKVKDLLVSVGMLTGYSFLMALLFSELGAPDVALTEAALGAGLTGVLLVAALHRLERRSQD
ncbi:MAG: DUF4040 domain-containing protein [Candidatus Eisenbacteria bacterium]|uniref:DUF4040 domain-containing protein n=1 Tax=Eiseniibacteriota bacterium TaxID=2212470 RepID=A0A937XD88_UNCEI|nr:DUF4040 domain-containing protein [Candidatus Eisenbacteria bacterium]